MTLAGKLLAALIVVSLCGAFATWRWSSASARCDTRIAEQRLDDARTAAKDQADALKTAAGIWAGERDRLRGEQTSAAGNTHTRETLIREVRVTGECVMPAGLPSLAPAVQEARDAARE
ncbi:hypothetical protein LDO31_02990 [Luteimonas sp. XNQY3]|nr:hypothetical protein [Luteimonas sp. XNQY3]MCD9005213.1 hypothetical protein [Luteimonas sp. XNQY3]